MRDQESNREPFQTRGVEPEWDEGIFGRNFRSSNQLVLTRCVYGNTEEIYTPSSIGYKPDIWGQ